uniref:Uncharacterized protein n=1 Tax=Nonomuraea gerenzanensis TaxID=93944 RepID=A0A1M4EEV5_9ACTN|nr:hypothetical protein BN4615_P6830 [Nonomuraea gerenzanensis]
MGGGLHCVSFLAAMAGAWLTWRRGSCNHTLFRRHGPGSRFGSRSWRRPGRAGRRRSGRRADDREPVPAPCCRPVRVRTGSCTPCGASRRRRWPARRSGCGRSPQAGGPARPPRAGRSPEFSPDCFSRHFAH